MAPHQSQSSALLRVRWQRRTVAILCNTAQAVIQQAADHFHLGPIINELVLVGRVDGAGNSEELELTTDTLRLLPDDATVTLTRTPRHKLPRGTGVAGAAQAKERRVMIHFAAVLHYELHTLSVCVRPTCRARTVLRTIARKLDMQEADLMQALDDIHPDISLRDNGIREGDVISFLLD